jgi:hypothetical protein
MMFQFVGQQTLDLIVQFLYLAVLRINLERQLLWLGL